MKSRKSSSKSPAPPPAFAGTRLIAYAILDRSIPYAGRGSIFVAGKVLGRVPRLALTTSGGETFVVYCSRAWRVLTMFGYPSVREAKRPRNGTTQACHAGGGVFTSRSGRWTGTSGQCGRGWSAASATVVPINSRRWWDPAVAEFASAIFAFANSAS